MNVSDEDVAGAEDWFVKGSGDLRTAETAFKYDKDPATATLCYLCQQATEKYLKGFLVFNGKIPPKIHDLLELLTLCLDIDADFKHLREDVGALNRYVIEPRYPLRPLIHYSREETEGAIQSIWKVIHFVTEKTKCH